MSTLEFKNVGETMATRCTCGHMFKDHDDEDMCSFEDCDCTGFKKSRFENNDDQALDGHPAEISHPIGWGMSNSLSMEALKNNQVSCSTCGKSVDDAAFKTHWVDGKPYCDSCYRKG